MRNGAQAAAQFQTFFDHRGVALNSMLAALARLGLARSHMLQGDTSKVRTAYEDFLILWRDADLDVPIYEQAKAEYRKLQ